MTLILYLGATYVLSMPMKQIKAILLLSSALFVPLESGATALIEQSYSKEYIEENRKGLASIFGENTGNLEGECTQAKKILDGFKEITDA